jgi:hypothetical protein
MVPVLRENMNAGIVKCFADNFIVKDLSEEQLLKVKEIEDAYKQTKAKVIAVLDQLAQFPGEETQMQCYIYVDSQSRPWIIDNKVGFMARVVNEGWDIEEDGSLAVIEIAGWLGRVM